MDGVIIDDEEVWKKYKDDSLKKILDEAISKKIGNTIGMSVNSQYDAARELGFEMSREEFQKIYDKAASGIYRKAEITPGIEELAKVLIRNNFKLGLVSSSAMSWIHKVLPRLSFANKFESVISLNERFDLKPKPNPDGYIMTMESLMSQPSSTIILEDSNSGIASAKASGAFTIAFTQNLIKGYKQIEADAKANNIREVIVIVRNLSL